MSLQVIDYRSLRPREFVSLARVGEWKNAEVGDKVLVEREPVSRLCVVIAGNAEVRRQGQSVWTLEPGHIIGTAIVMAGGPSPVDARFT